MAGEHCLRLVEPHHHEGGGIGIGGGAIVGDDGGGEDGVLHRIACGGVDGVGVFATVLVIEITIVAAGGHRLVGDVDDGLYLLIDIERIVGGLGDAYLPRQALLADAAGDYLTAYLYHIIVDALAPEIIGNNIAAIAFGINSGAYVSEIIRAGILSIDKGQTEAGRSLGLNGYQTMTRIIIPQAIKNIFPALCNEFIVLIKETAIVGYVGLMDIQKAGDFIKSATFEAFMPLIGTAVIYYVLIKILTLILNRVELKLRKSEIR